MKKYETLIFDLDDTLIDNRESIRYAIQVIFNLLGIAYSDELFEAWKKFDDDYWHMWESGKMYIPDSVKSLEEKIAYLRTKRFVLFFQNQNLSYEKAHYINELYCSMLGVNILEIPGAKDLLEDLNRNHEIVIATNGPKEAAFNKMGKAMISQFVSNMVCSEEVGFSKPNIEFFEFLFDRIKNKDKNSMLLIGDSLTTDIQGGINAGIDTCWFNRMNSDIPEENAPTMVINDLIQLKRKL